MLALHELYMLLTLVHTVSDGCSVDSETSEELALWYCFRGLWKLSLRMCWSIRPTWLADHNVRYMICCSLFWLVNIKVKSPRLHLSEVHINININIYICMVHTVSDGCSVDSETSEDLALCASGACGNSHRECADQYDQPDWRFKMSDIWYIVLFLDLSMSKWNHHGYI